jgi:uncharacterized membrane protein
MGEFGHGWGMWFWWVLIGVGILWFLWMLPTFGKPRGGELLDAEELLRRRLAAGEIDDEEFDRLLAKLRDDRY